MIRPGKSPTDKHTYTTCRETTYTAQHMQHNAPTFKDMYLTSEGLILDSSCLPFQNITHIFLIPEVSSRITRASHSKKEHSQLAIAMLGLGHADFTSNDWKVFPKRWITDNDNVDNEQSLGTQIHDFEVVKQYTLRKLTAGTQTLVVWLDVSPFSKRIFF